MYRTEEYIIHQGRNIPKYLHPSNKKHNVSQEESIKKIINHVEQRNNPQPAIRTFVSLDILNSDLPDFQKNRMNSIYNQQGEFMFDDTKYKHAKKRTEKSALNSMPVNDGAIPLKNVYRYKPPMTEIESIALTPRHLNQSYDFDLSATTPRSYANILIGATENVRKKRSDAGTTRSPKGSSPTDNYANQKNGVSVFPDDYYDSPLITKKPSTVKKPSSAMKDRLRSKGK